MSYFKEIIVKICPTLYTKSYHSNQYKFNTLLLIDMKYLYSPDIELYQKRNDVGAAVKNSNSE